jgi:hypothetical protein
MTAPIKRSRRQLALPLEGTIPRLDAIEQIRKEVVEALADLLLEALGSAELAEPGSQQGVRDEL